MSKSDLTGVCPQDIARFGTDTVRFMLLRHGRLEGDMSYYSELCNDSWAELATLLGNLASRITSKKYTEKLVKFEFDFDSEQQTLCERLSYITQQSHALYETGQIYKHIELIFSHLKEVNRYFTLNYKSAKKSSVQTLCLETVRIIAILLMPVMPTKMNELLDIVGAGKDQRLLKHAHMNVAADTMVKPAVLFPKPAPVISTYEQQ